ncbi:hypothetical protein Tco_1515626 [Tanacetum coccineum]
MKKERAKKREEKLKREERCTEGKVQKRKNENTRQWKSGRGGERAREEVWRRAKNGRRERVRVESIGTELPRPGSGKHMASGRISFEELWVSSKAPAWGNNL